MGIGAKRAASRGSARVPACAFAAAFALAALLLSASPLVGRAQAGEVTYTDVSGQEAQPVVLTEEGAGGTRLITPHYSVFLESRLFPDGFAYEYTESLDGAYGVLDVYTASQALDGSASGGVPGQPTYRLYCVAYGASASPFAGSYATAEFYADGTHVVVARPYGTGFADGGAAARAALASAPEGASADAAPSAAGTEDAATAQDLALAMSEHLSADTKARLVANADGSTGIVTPWYTVTVPSGMFPNGWYYSYSDAVDDWSGNGSGAYMGRTLNVYAIGEGLAFSVYCGKDAAPQGEYAVTTVGEFGGDWAGWHVGVYKHADYALHSAEEELALLAPYAALVTPTSDPSVNPPDLP